MLLVRLPDLPFHWVNWDEGAMMSQAYAMTRGEELYRDIFQIHPLLNIAIYIPFFAVLSPEWVPHAVKLFNLFLVGAGGILVYRMCRRWSGSETAALIGAVMFVFTLGRRWALTSFGAFYTIFPILLSVDLLFLRGKPDRKAYAQCGVLWGLAVFMKQVAVFDIAALLLCLLILQRRSLSDFRTAALFSLLGFSAVTGVVALYFLSRGTLIDALQASVLRPIFGYAQAWPAQPGDFVQARKGLLEQALQQIYITFPLPLFAMVCGLGRALLEGAARRGIFPEDPGSENDDRARAFFWILLVWMGADLLGILFIGRFYPNYLLAMVPGLCLAAVYWAAGLGERPLRSLAAGILLVLFGIAIFQFARSVKEGGWMPYKVRRSKAIAAHIASHTREEERIFLFQYAGTDVFYLSERLSNNGVYLWIDMCDGHIKDTAAAESLREKFLRNLPTLIVTEAKGGVPRGCELMKDFMEKVLAGSYERAATLYDANIFMLRKESVDAHLPETEEPQFLAPSLSSVEIASSTACATTRYPSAVKCPFGRRT